MEWIDWYNHAGLHSRLGYLTPIEYEAAYYVQEHPIKSIFATVRHRTKVTKGRIPARPAWRWRSS